MRAMRAPISCFTNKKIVVSKWHGFFYLKDEKILSAFEEKQSITGVHKITGYNWQQIAKVLSTYGIVANDTHEIILNLYDRGKNAKEISEITGYAETTVHAYLPRVRPAYNENISENAKRIKKYRQNK